MTKMICDCCGGAVDPIRLKCEYCGTEYRMSHMDDRVVHFVQTLAEALIPYIKIETERSIYTTLR